MQNGRDRIEQTSYAELLAQRVRVLQIITLALVIGILVFFGVVMAIRLPAAGAAAPAGAPPAQPPGMILSLVAFALLATGALGAVIIPVIVSRAKREQLKPDVGAADATRGQQILEPMLQAYQMQHILRAALIEGPAFVGLIGYMTEGHVWALIVPAVSVAVLLAIVPTVNRALRWMGQEA